ncbi:MAG TPA: 30S ribosomal protein S9 [Candidatus Brocadiia bacterium]|nr:30S ribosomal protein S9 [Candidatus Brocadiia bacterium]
MSSEAGTVTSDYIWGTGRRKTSVARVRVRLGEGEIIVNQKPFEKFFSRERDRQTLVAPLKLTKMLGKYDVYVTTDGGGTTGQAGAASLGLSRCLAKADNELEHQLREAGLLTRDSRRKERKKYGLRGARRGCQFSKR